MHPVDRKSSILIPHRVKEKMLGLFGPVWFSFLLGRSSIRANISRDVRSESRYSSARRSVNGYIALIAYESSHFRIVDHIALGAAHWMQRAQLFARSKPLSNSKACKVNSLHFLGSKGSCKLPSPERIGGSRNVRILQSIGGEQKLMLLP
jgi:hypothetical protein